MLKKPEKEIYISRTGKISKDIKRKYKNNLLCWSFDKNIHRHACYTNENFEGYYMIDNGTLKPWFKERKQAKAFIEFAIKRKELLEKRKADARNVINKSLEL
jgi:hypothetical protein